ncbi:MAG: hypothetical protein GX601_07285 [Anaerolineales bacterium]|nr:hypothetical protein [Anaerolineales bacterium]
MPKIEERIEISAPSSEVFRYAHDVEARPEWDTRVVRVELLSPPPVRSGTLFRADAARGGQYSFSWDGEYSAFHFPSGSAIRVLDAAPSSPWGRGSTETWDFSSSGGATRFSITWEYTARGFVNRVLDALGGRAQIRRSIRRSLTNIKAQIERR